MQSVLKNYTRDQIEQAKKIRALIFDVDGVLTDGSIIYSNSGDEIKAFNVKDGQIIRFIKENNILVGAITGRDSEVVRRRCEELKLNFYKQGIKDKGALLKDICKEYLLEPEEVAYIGDDIIDLQALSMAGLAAVPADGLGYVRDQAHLVTLAKGGKGVLREVADFILAAQGHLESVVNHYLEHGYIQRKSTGN